MSGLNKDDVIRMAQNVAGVSYPIMEGIKIGMSEEHLERFANLIAAAEREACAVIAFNAKTYLEAAAAIRARGNDAA